MLQGSALLHHVAVRILARYLERQGRGDVTVQRTLLGDAEAVDLTFRDQGRTLAVKVKADSYYGSDPVKIADRTLTYYRPETHSYGLEVIANSATREPGWVSRSRADQLFYYRFVIAQTEEEVAALAEEPDDVFFAELAVERDDLRILPMPELRAWFERTKDRFTPRPVMTDGRPAWYRIAPSEDVEAGVTGIRSVGPVFAAIASGAAR